MMVICRCGGCSLLCIMLCSFGFCYSVLVLLRYCRCLVAGVLVRRLFVCL